MKIEYSMKDKGFFTSNKLLEKKIAAFTLMELIVSMALFSIIVYFFYIFIGFLHKYMENISEREDNVVNKISFYGMFGHQWESADSIKFIDGALIHWIKGSKHTWHFRDTAVVFDGEGGRIFSMGSYSYSYCYTCQNKSLASGNYLTSLKVNLGSNYGDTLSFEFWKDYGVNFKELPQ